MVRSKYFA